MKKFFTLIALAFIAVVGAKAVNLWTGSQSFEEWSGNVKIEASSFAEVSAGAVLSVTYTQISEATDFTLAFKDPGAEGWPLIPSTTFYNATSSPQQLMLYGYQLSILKTNGLVLQGTGITVTSVDYENPTTALSDNVLWYGELYFDDSWGTSTSIGAGAFSSAAVGDVIRVIYKDKRSNYNPVFKHNDWNDFTELTKVEGDGYFEAEITAEALTELQANGLRFQGLGFTMTEVQLISATPSDPTLLWSSETATAIGWNDNIKVSAAKFTASGAKVGDFIKIKVSDFAENHQLSVYTDWEVIYGHKGLFVNGDTEYVLGITKTIFDAMTAKGFFVAGSGLNVSEVRLVEGDVVADEVMWFGSFVMNGNNFMELSGMTIPDAAKSIEVEFDGGGEGSWMAFKATTNGWPILETKKIIGNSVIKFAVTEEMRATIGHIVLQGDKYTVKSIKYSTEELKDVYSVIGTLSGNWDTDTDMTLGADGKYSVTFAGLAAGNYEFKIRVNNSWDENYGLDGQKNGVNVKITVETAGDVTIFFDPETKLITYTGAIATGISTISAAKQQSGVRYNLAGQKVDASYKGVVIENGRKMVQK